jgi:hypothetical protein
MLVDQDYRTSRRTSRKLGDVCAVVVAVATSTFVAVGVRAKPPDHVDPALISWFQSLSNPISGLSCCAEYDGHILASRDWRVTADGYQVQIAGSWHDVPPQAVLNHIANPTGGAVAFFPPGGSPIYCFVRPTDS